MNTTPNAVTPRPWEELVVAIRPQTDAEKARLAASLEAHGQQHAVLVMPDGRIIDGYHRWSILGDRAAVQVVDVTEDEGYALGFTLNAARRQLSAADMRKIDAAYEDAIVRLRDAGQTQQQVADTLGVAQSTVSTTERKARARKAASGEAPAAKIVDKRVKVNAAGRRRIMDLLAKGTPRQKVADRMKVSVATVSKIAKEERDAAAQADVQAAEALTVTTLPTVSFQVADRPRESARRLHEALLATKFAAANPAQVGAALLRCVVDETGNPADLLTELRRALTPTQWQTLSGAVVAMAAPAADDQEGSQS